MKTKVKAIPEGWHSVTAYISVKGAVEAIEFYKNAFGAKETGAAHDARWKHWPC